MEQSSDFMLRFYDYDRTLCVHNYPAWYQANDNYEIECVTELAHQAELHENDRPLPCMQWYAMKCYRQGDKLFCLTHEIFSLRDELKKNFIARWYAQSPMKYLSTNTPEHKIDMIKAIAKIEGVPLSRCEIVDDKMETIYLATKEGIIGTHLSNIALLYEELNAEQLEGL